MISIVIPCYNRENLIVQTLLSIKKQTYEDWECIIVDDGSQDGTYFEIEKFIETDSRFKLYKRPETKPKGPSACRNYAITKSKGDYLQFFDSDDVMHPDHLKIKFEAINTHDFQFVSCDLKRVVFENELDFDLYKKKDLDNNLDIFKDFVKGGFPLMMMAPLWKFDFIKLYLPMREDMDMLEDHELYARALKDVTSYFHINKVLILLRDGHESLTNKFLKDVSSGVVSYLKATKTVFDLIDGDNEIELALLKKVLWVFRLAIAQKEYDSADLCLTFIKKNTKGIILNMKILRIEVFYNLFRSIGRGDTLFKRLLKI
ncbi:glycosyltransferase involved in cell wall biosynthesis [Mariniflexile fucanivorans]|uniref:Glycosyltransferase involved in cell wall biosynthesis n=1 Tax=Mariniflexile fucanivorans TaxID=264023 RepID=A0A4R1RE97_9FLAO|nr:glycosyltransferase family 2 protein [Mariniflexile fucanivorans]TCL63882.1 glycosyltransferase involved in cell wall biosynthesis [Mariniflexile fucanivorans]